MLYTTNYPYHLYNLLIASTHPSMGVSVGEMLLTIESVKSAVGKYSAERICISLGYQFRSTSARLPACLVFLRQRASPVILGEGLAGNDANLRDDISRVAPSEDVSPGRRYLLIPDLQVISL